MCKGKRDKLKKTFTVFSEASSIHSSTAFKPALFTTLVTSFMFYKYENTAWFVMSQRSHYGGHMAQCP